jgi:hypothetical protein
LWRTINLVLDAEIFALTMFSIFSAPHLRIQVNGTLTELLLEWNDRITEKGAAILAEALSINVV